MDYQALLQRVERGDKQDALTTMLSSSCVPVVMLSYSSTNHHAALALPNKGIYDWGRRWRRSAMSINPDGNIGQSPEEETERGEATVGDKAEILRS
ncbi:hypothetical protein CERSUDRAFT_88330 [Gelatoporia subvermispora B]|uniref:Uncharacterized protein n=1 Tax=Ceriporiopsis subvermispora (strain B) TaxID=914234 RepID=M2P9B7_CERS8|nr:hypothetical protein CERSUDRAFT_88330 [Gelatoporia subvermispora B]